MNEVSPAGVDHWTIKKTVDGDVRLFLFQKPATTAETKGTLLFVHGSSMASQPTFDLKVSGRSWSSAMDYFAAQGFDCWCTDMEGYGRSDKSRDINFDISNGADDLEAATAHIMRTTATQAIHLYGISSGALRAALFAQRHPERTGRVALDAFVWTGEGSPTLAQRKEKLPEYLAMNSRPVDRAFVQSIFNRDHPGTAEEKVVNAFADAILSLDDRLPTGTYVDMCSKLPIVDPEKILSPTMIMRGEYDGIASVEDLLAFFKNLPNPDKRFCFLPGIAHASFQQKNYMMVYDILNAFLQQPAPVYTGA